MNSGYITEALIARLHNTNPEAVAPNMGPRLLRDIEASLRVKVEKVADFAEAFALVSSHGPGTNALLLILAKKDVRAHVVIITNHNGVPTIIEGQSWGPTYPQGVFTSPVQAQERYGTEVDLKLGIIPSPMPAQ
jgi:hypothetical protein